MEDVKETYMLNPQYQQTHAPQMGAPMMGGMNAHQHIMGVLQTLGVTTAQFAQEAQRVGIGHASAIQSALENGDARPLQAYAKYVADNNPQLVQQAGVYYGRMYGNPTQGSGW